MTATKAPAVEAEWHLRCLLCPEDEKESGAPPQKSTVGGLVAMQEHAWDEHLQGDPALPDSLHETMQRCSAVTLEEGRGYEYVLPDGRPWLRAAKGPPR